MAAVSIKDAPVVLTLTEIEAGHLALILNHSETIPYPNRDAIGTYAVEASSWAIYDALYDAGFEGEA